MMPPQPGPPGAQPPGPPPPNPELQKAQQQLQQIEKQLTQIQENKQVLQLLRDEKTRGYRIEIETDSTIEPDEQAEKKSRIEFTEITGKFLGEALPILQVMPQAAPLFEQAMLFLVRGFRAGREMEDTIETVMQQIGQAAQQPKPDPEQQKIEAQLKQSEQQHQQTMAQSDQQHQQTLQQKGVEFQQKMALEQEKAQREREQHAMTMQAAERQGQMAEEQHGRDLEAKQEDKQMEREQSDREYSLEREKLDATKQEAEAGRDFERDKASLPKRDEVKSAIERGAAVEESLAGLIDEAKQIKAALEAITEDLQAPAEIIRGRDGKASGVRKGSRTMNIRRGPDGAVQGLQ